MPAMKSLTIETVDILAAARHSHAVPARDASLSAARAMTSSGWRSVLVVDAHGKVLGVVSGHDLMKFVRDGVDESKVVRDVMHPALTIDINASLREAANMLIQNHHHRLVVVDKEDPDSFPIGAISTFDIVSAMARPDSVWQQ